MFYNAIVARHRGEVRNMLESHAEELLAQVRQGGERALEAMGATAAELVRAQLHSGYGSPVERTGALITDVRWTAEDGRVLVGSTLPYAACVHEGTSHMPARPYLADALQGSAAQLEEAAKRGFDIE